MGRPPSGVADRHSAKEAAQAGARAEDDVSAQPRKQPGRQNAYCVQWRSAIATEDQARYTRWGLWLIGLTLGAGTIAAVAAWRTVATMDDTARRQLRAYISVEPGGIHPISAGPFVIGYVSLRNTGNLPAGKASWIINLDFSRDHKRKDFSPKEIDAEGSAVIFPRVAIFRATRRGETSVHQSSDDAPLFGTSTRARVIGCYFGDTYGQPGPVEGNSARNIRSRLALIFGAIFTSMMARLKCLPSRMTGDGLPSTSLGGPLPLPPGWPWDRCGQIFALEASAYCSSGIVTVKSPASSV